MLKHAGIGAKIAIVFILLITLLITGFGMILYIKSTAVLENQIILDLQQLMALNKTNLENMITYIDQATLSLFMNKTLLNALFANPSGEQLYTSQKLLDQQLSNLPLTISNVLAPSPDAIAGGGLELVRKYMP